MATKTRKVDAIYQNTLLTRMQFLPLIASLNGKMRQYPAFFGVLSWHLC